MNDRQFHIHERPLPPTPDGISWRDHLILLLHIAAELELSLMVQYLYSACSLGGTHSREEARWVHERRDAIPSVSREGMGHLPTVQNTLCLLGGRISSRRGDGPWDTPYYPFDLCLEPLILTSLARCVFAEMPATHSDDEMRDCDAARAAVTVLGLRAAHPGRPVQHPRPHAAQ